MTSSTSNSKTAGGLLLRIAILALIVIAINQLILAALPFAWGEISFNNRYNFYEAHKEEFDTIFIGSSRTYRHIDPTIFDGQVAVFKSTNSYNLGAAANFFPKTYRTFRDVLADKPDALETIFFEVSVSRIFPPRENWHTLEQVYWYDLETVQYLLRSIWRADHDLVGKFLYTAVNIGTLVEKNINFGFGVDILLFILSDHYEVDTYLGPQSDGYYPLEDQMTSGTSEKKLALSRRRNNMLKDPNELDIRVKDSVKFYNNPDLWSPADAVYLDMFQQMQMVAEDEGVELIFVLHPRLGRSYKNLIPLFNSLPASNRIEIVDPEKYPEFYKLENSFDQGHLNKATAEIFTEFLAQEFIALQE